MPTSEQLVYAENPNFGGPASVKVVSDSGISGSRGTDFFLSSGNPNTYGKITYTRPESLNDHIQRFYYSSSVFSGTIASGEIKFDNPLLPTKIYISTKNTNGLSISNIVKLSFLSIEPVKGSITINEKIPFQTAANPLNAFGLKVISFSSVFPDYIAFDVESSFKTDTFSPSNGDEVILTFLDRPKLFDICTNINPFDEGYLDLYTYRNPVFPGEVGTKWYNDLALTPAGFPLNFPATFTAGEANVQGSYPIPQQLAAIAPFLTAANVSIQFSIIGNNPIAANVVIDPVSGLTVSEGNFELDIDFKASEYANGSWVALSGQKIIHVIITLDITP